MAERIRIDHGNLAAGKRLLRRWKIPQSVKREIFRFLDDLALGKVNRGRKLSQQRQLKYLHALRIPLEFFNKPTSNIKLCDMEDFEKALSGGRIRTRLKSRPFSHNTQVDIQMLLKIFLRWSVGPNQAERLTNWLDMRPRRKTPDFLTEMEVEKLYKSCRNAKQRFLIAVLFDSGARAEEFHNIRYEDIYLPEGSENFPRIALKEEYSKTFGRTIALYWKFSIEAITEYVAERVAQGIRASDPIFDGNYDATKRWLWRLGKKVLNRNLHYHLLRHASVTQYANQLNRQELCYRYGWRFSSNMPDVYISRAGMATRRVDEKFAQTNLASVREDLAKLEQTDKIKTERIRQLENTIKMMQDAGHTNEERVRELRRSMQAVVDFLRLHPPIDQIEAAARAKSIQQVASEEPKSDAI